MAEVELTWVDQGDANTDGHVTITRRTSLDPFSDPEHIVQHTNPGQRAMWSHSYHGALSSDPDDPENWIEDRGLVVFDFADIQEPYRVIGMRGRIERLIRHYVGSTTLEAFAYQSSVLSWPFDFDAVFPGVAAASDPGWFDLSGLTNVLNPIYDIDERIQAHGGSISPDVNIASWNTAPEDAPAIEWTFTDTSWAEGKAGGRAGLLFCVREDAPPPKALDLASFPLAATNPHNRFDTWGHVLIVDTGAVEPVEIAASGVIQLTGSAGIAPPPRRRRFHTARWTRNRRG